MYLYYHLIYDEPEIGRTLQNVNIIYFINLKIHHQIKSRTAKYVKSLTHDERIA